MSQPEQTGKIQMTQNAIKALALGQNRSAILSTGLARVNHLTRAARHLPELLSAFAEWSAGEIYICKKTGTFRYRFGDRSKGITPWNSIARDLFPTAADFAFAAAVFYQDEPTNESASSSAPETRQDVGTRVNVISIAA